MFIGGLFWWDWCQHILAPAELPRGPTVILRPDSQSWGQELSFEPNPSSVASELGFVNKQLTYLLWFIKIFQHIGCCTSLESSWLVDQESEVGFICQQTADRFVLISEVTSTYWVLHLLGKHLTCRIYVSWCQKLTPYTWKPCLRHQVYYSKSFISKINKQLTFAKIV